MVSSFLTSASTMSSTDNSVCHLRDRRSNVNARPLLAASAADGAEGSADAPLPVGVIQVGDGAVGHGVDRLAQQPVFVLKHTDQTDGRVTGKPWKQQLVDLVLVELEVIVTFPGLSKLPSRGARTSLNSFWY